MYKVIRFLELMWIVIAACCVVIGTYKLVTIGITDAMFFYVFCLLAVFLFLLRRKQRRNIEKHESKK
jgi:Flp pilus assembly protein TadB